MTVSSRRLWFLAAVAIVLIVAAAAVAWIVLPGATGGGSGAPAGDASSGGRSRPATSVAPVSGGPRVSRVPQPIERPSRPATPGAPLTELAQPPEDTIVMLEPSGAEAGSAYDVSFQPFGLAEDGVVVRIVAAKPVGAVKKPTDLQGKNVLVTAEPGMLSRIGAGGEYRGRLTLVSSDGLLVPTISGVREAGR